MTHTLNKPSVASLLPIRKVGPGYILLRNPEQIVICFRLKKGVCPWGDASNSLERSMAGFDSALQQIRPDEQVQFFTRRIRQDGSAVALDYAKNFSSSAPETYLHGYGPFYQTWLQRWVDGSGISQYESYALFTVKPPDMTEATGGIFKVFGLKGQPKGISIDEVSRRAHSWADGLSNAGIQWEDMTENEILGLLYEEVSLGEIAVDPSLLKSGTSYSGGSGGFQTVRQSLATMPWNFTDEKTFRIGNLYGHVIPVTEFPEASQSLLFLQELYFQRVNFRVSLFVNGTNQEHSKAIIQAQMRKNQSTSIKGNLVDRDSEAAFEERDIIMGMLSRRETSLVKYSLYITIFDEDLSALQTSVERITSSLPAFHPHEGYCEQKELFQSALPFGRNITPHHTHLSCTAVLKNALCVFDDPLTHGDGIPYGTSQGGQLVNLNLWGSQLSNWNVGIFGIAGKGKSFCTNHLIIRSMVLNPSVMIVDASGSYESVCSTVGGKYLKISLNNPESSINVFHCDMDELKKNEGQVNQNHVGDIMSFLQVLCAEVGSAGLSNIAIAILEEGVRLTYEKTYKAMVKAKGHTDPPRLRDFQATLKEMGNDEARTPEARTACKNYATMLQPYVLDGSYANLTDRLTSLDESTKFVVFDTKDMPDDEKLKALAVFIITQYCLKRSEKNKMLGQKSLLVLDEAWTLVQFAAGCNFLLKVAKTSRHLMLASIFATQQVSDILNHPQAKPLFDNASLKFLLGLADTDIPLVGELMGLSDREMSDLRNLRMVRGQYSQMLVNSSVQQGVLNFTPDPLSLVIATTYPPERLERAYYLKKYAASGDPMSSFKALMRWMDDRLQGKVEKVQAEKEPELLRLPPTELEVLGKLSEKYSPTGDSLELLRLITSWSNDKVSNKAEA